MVFCIQEACELSYVERAGRGKHANAVMVGNGPVEVHAGGGGI